MKKPGTLRNIVLLFVGVLVFYAASYLGIEHWRTRNGPWIVTFSSTPSGEPTLAINQPALGISNVVLLFSNLDTTNRSTETIRFDRARKWPYSLPHGECIFMDTQSLPGTVVLSLFGHEVQLLPAGLTIDKHGEPWSGNRTLAIPAGPPFHGTTGSTNRAAP